MSQGHVTALFEHDVEVQVRGEPLVELDGTVIEARPLGCEIVGPHDRGVSSRPSAPYVALLHDRHIGDAVVAGEVVGGGETVNPTTHDDHVIGRGQFVLFPDLWPW